MKKTIKSVLIAALVALLGSSAWAATIDKGKVNVSQNSTNDLEQAYLPTEIVDSTVDDFAIAKIVTTTDGYVGITGAGRDGDTKVTLTGTDGNQYVYEVSAITIELSKTVKAWNEEGYPDKDVNNKSNATISIISHILNNPKPTPPNVLFIGTLCPAHSLTNGTVKMSLDAAAKNANVDYYLISGSSDDEKGG